MGWSLWIDVPVVEQPAWKTFQTGAVTTVTDGPVTVVEEVFGDTLTLLVGSSVNFDDNQVDTYRNHIQFLAGDANSGVTHPLFPLPFIPPNFFDHVEPGYPGGPDGQFIDWEGDEGQHLGWRWPGPPRAYGSATPPVSDGEPLPGTLEIISPSSYFVAPPGSELTNAPGFPLPRGTPTASFTGLETYQSPLPPFPDPGPVIGFAITIATPDPSPPNLDRFFNPAIPAPMVRIQYPRWRYWIEEDPPLRVYQRGDGLGAGSPRVYGVGSRQKSSRVYGYQ